jgi:CheY-like chemotaxis protein
VPARILVVDDQEEVRDFTSRILRRAGHEVVLAANGHEGLAAVRDADFDLILMDFHMPVMDGLTAAQEIRALEGSPSKIPIIAFSAGEQSLMAAGVNDYICKPFEKAELLLKVDAWLSRDGNEPPAGRAADKPAPTAFEEACELMGRPWAIRGLTKLKVQIDEAFGAESGQGSGQGGSQSNGQLAGQAHALVSVAAVLGFSLLSERCSVLEEACRSGHGVRLAFEQAKVAALSARTAAIGLIADLEIQPT